MLSRISPYFVGSRSAGGDFKDDAARVNKKGTDNLSVPTQIEFTFYGKGFVLFTQYTSLPFALAKTPT